LPAAVPERATDFLGLKAGVAVAVDEVSDILFSCRLQSHCTQIDTNQ
jgi:hypothetical protein